MLSSAAAPAGARSPQRARQDSRAAWLQASTLQENWGGWKASWKCQLCVSGCKVSPLLIATAIYSLLLAL